VPYILKRSKRSQGDSNELKINPVKRSVFAGVLTPEGGRGDDRMSTWTIFAVCFTTMLPVRGRGLHAAGVLPSGQEDESGGFEGERGGAAGHRKVSRELWRERLFR
jgi:hypothetical protein